MRLNAIVTHEFPWYVARCVEVDVAAQGATAEEAKDNLQEALAASDPAVSPLSDRPVVAEIDVPARVAPGNEARGVDRADLMRHLDAAGWQVTPRGDYEMFRCPKGDHAIWLSRTAQRVAPGVFRVVLEAAADDLAPRAGVRDVLERLDALFARYPNDHDTTRLVREERDGR